MRTLFLLLVATICSTEAQTIATRVLSPTVPTRIALSPALTTTLLFPSAISGTFGLGLVSSQNANGVVQLDHPDGSNVLVLHALTDNAHVIATVLLSGALYVFDLQCSQTPDIAVTLINQDLIAPRAVEVTPEQIKEQRPQYDAELLIGLLRRARDVNILRPIYPDLYDGYKSKECAYTTDSGTYKTEVVQVHRFSKEDAIVLQATVTNETDQPLSFDGRAATVQVANEVHPIKLLDCLRPIPPHKRTLIDVVIQGDVDGGRANLSVDNEFRLMLPGDTGIWSLKNGGPSDKFNVPKPVIPPRMPLTQVKRDK